jgi:hypothetical protein
MNASNYLNINAVEQSIIERGYLSYEDLMQMTEYRPWFFRALADCLHIDPRDLKELVAEREVKVSVSNVFGAITTHRHNTPPKLSLLTQEVIYE